MIASAMIDRQKLLAIGGFDEHFPYYLDEADVCLRLARAGYETVYLPDAPVRHYPAMSPIGPPFIRNRRLIARSDTSGRAIVLVPAVFALSSMLGPGLAGQLAAGGQFGGLLLLALGSTLAPVLFYSLRPVALAAAR